MAHQVDDNCHHIWIHYPAKSYSVDSDVFIRLNLCFASRQAAHYRMNHLREQWKDLPRLNDAAGREVITLRCREDCTCEPRND